MKLNQFKKELKAFVENDEDPVVHADSAGQYAVSFINFRYMIADQYIPIYVFDSIEIVDDTVFIYYGRDKMYFNYEYCDGIEFYKRRPFNAKKN